MLKISKAIIFMTKDSKLRLTRIVVKCILGIIILSFIFSSMNSYIKTDSEKYAAIVNGEKISLKILKNMYFIEREKQKKMFGKDFLKLSNNKTFIKETYNHILSQLINNILLEQYAKKIGLEVNDHQIKEIILNSSMFQKNKKFNKNKYFNYLASINLTNNEYINIIKTKINTENLIHSIADTDFLLDHEQENIIRLLSQKRIIKKAILKIDHIIDKQNVTDAEAKNYFCTHKNSFFIPKKFKVNFVQIQPNKFKIKYDDKEINEWYLNNIEKYSTKEQRRYSVIQTKTKNDALSILSQLHNAPENFSKIAQKQSIDPISSQKGGDIGWIPIDLIPNEIKNANLNQKNEISEIMPFRNEFLIIKLNDILLSKKKKIHEVYDTIKKEIKNKKSLDLYHKFNNKISDIVNIHPDQLNTILKKNNISIQETNWFDKNSIPKILNIPILKKIIFNKKLIDKKDRFHSHFNFIILKDNQSFLIKIKDFQNKKMQIFKNAKKNIVKKLQFKKAIKEAQIQSEKIITELKKGNENLFKQSNLFFGPSETISRYDENPITSIVFSLPYPDAEKKIYALFQDKNKNFVIILLEQVYEKNFSEKEKKIIIEYLEKNNTEIVFNSILKNLRETSKIQYEKIEEI